MRSEATLKPIMKSTDLGQEFLQNGQKNEVNVYHLDLFSRYVALLGGLQHLHQTIKKSLLLLKRQEQELHMMDLHSHNGIHRLNWMRIKQIT